MDESYVSASALSIFRPAVVRSFLSSKMPLANVPVVLHLLGSDEVLPFISYA